MSDDNKPSVSAPVDIPVATRRRAATLGDEVEVCGRGNTHTYVPKRAQAYSLMFRMDADSGRETRASADTQQSSRDPKADVGKPAERSPASQGGFDPTKWQEKPHTPASAPAGIVIRRSPATGQPVQTSTTPEGVHRTVGF